MKPRNKILSLLASTMLFLSITNFIAIKGLWYYLFWYFDMPMHLIGGMAVLFLLVYIFYTKISFFSYIPIFQLLIGVLFIGISWEIFEYIMLNIYGGQPFLLFDTLSDICFDMAGGTFALLYIIKK